MSACGTAEAQASAAVAPVCLPYEFQTLHLGDGRTLAYAVMGAPLTEAKLVCVYHHGTPASLVEAEPVATAGASLGVTVVSFDRPGMGGSTFHPRMTLASVADDAAQLMDHLHLSAAVQMGESGGAPYAAAFAALHPGRTQQLLLLAGLAATHGKQHRHLRRSLQPMDRWCMSWRGSGAGLLINSVVKMAAKHTPGMVKNGAGDSLGPSDASFLQDNDTCKDWLLRFVQRAYHGGLKGVLRDYGVLAQDWGVDVAAVQARTVIWHGKDDNIVPHMHAEWYHANISGSHLLLMEDEGHISLAGRHAGTILQDALQAMLERPAPSQPAAAAGGPAGGAAVEVEAWAAAST